MPQFNFRVEDSYGQVLTGSIEALSANDAVTQLGSKGYRVQEIGMDKSLQDSLVHQQPQASLSRPAPTGGSPQLGGSAGFASAGSVAHSVSNSGSAVLSSGRTGIDPVQVRHATQSGSSVRTKILSDKESFLLFAQMSNIIRSGIGPTSMLETMASRPNIRQDVSEALRGMAIETASGKALSEAMAKYPDLFAPGSVGSVRAGEQGGYLWDALHSVSAQMEEVGKLKRYSWWLGFTLWSCIAFFPLVFIVGKGLDGMMATINTGENALQALMQGMGKGMLGIWGFLTVVLVFGWWWLGKYLQESKFRHFRHKLAATSPGVSKRSKGVCLEALAYHYDRAMHAGLSPQRSWDLAIHSLPNLYISQKMVAESGHIGEGTPLSQIIMKSTVFPDQFKPYMETAEMSGTTEQAMGSVMEYSIQERKSAETWMKVKVGIWITLISFATSVLVFIVLFRLYFDSAFKNILGE